jgi:hypothetical protein
VCVCVCVCVRVRACVRTLGCPARWAAWLWDNIEPVISPSPAQPEPGHLQCSQRGQQRHSMGPQGRPKSQRCPEQRRSCYKYHGTAHSDTSGHLGWAAPVPNRVRADYHWRAVAALGSPTASSTTNVRRQILFNIICFIDRDCHCAALVSNVPATAAKESPALADRRGPASD